MWVEASRRRRIFGLALPIVGGMVSQNVLNLVDTAMVGTLGNAALAAVGVGGIATYMCQSLILGISTGVQATAARRKGEGRKDAATVLNTGILQVVLLGSMLTAAIYPLTPAIMGFLNTDAQVVELGSTYLQIRLLSAVFVGVNFAFRGYWNAMDLSRLYMGTLVVMHAANVALNYVLIFGHMGFPALGTKGAAIGTAGSTLIGTITYVFLALHHARAQGFLARWPSWVELRGMAKLSIPNGLQQLFFAAGLAALYWVVGRVGTAETAACNVLINLILTAVLPGMALGMAAATLVGQALGRKDVADAKAWGWDVTRIGLVGIGLIGLPMAICPQLVLQPFLHDPHAMELALVPMRASGIYLSWDAAGLILMHSLLGAGDAKRVMGISVGLQWGFFLPLAYLLGTVWGQGLLGIWLLQGLYRLIQSGVFAYIWHKGTWATIKI